MHSWATAAGCCFKTRETWPRYWCPHLALSKKSKDVLTKYFFFSIRCLFSAVNNSARNRSLSYQPTCTIFHRVAKCVRFIDTESFFSSSAFGFQLMHMCELMKLFFTIPLIRKQKHLINLMQQLLFHQILGSAAAQYNSVTVLWLNQYECFEWVMNS